MKNKEKYMINDPCNILFFLQTKDNEIPAHVEELIKHQMKKSFKCFRTNILASSSEVQNKETGYEYILDIKIADSTLKSAFTTAEEAYTL